MALFTQGKYSEAAGFARTMTERYPLNGFGWSLLGASFKQLGRGIDALAAMEKAAALMPNAVEPQYNLGLTLHDLGRLTEAEACYRRALKIRSDYAEAHYNLGITLHDLGKLNEAEASFRRAIQVRPDDADAFSNLGLTLHDLGRLDDAEICYRRALEFRPDFAQAHFNLGVTLQALGRLDEAEACYRQTLEIKPDFADAYNNQGLTLQDLGKPNEAEACLRQALQIRPGFAQAHFNLGVTLQALGRLDEAEACYRRALEIRPDFADAHNNLGNTLKDLGRLNEAEISFQRALVIRPDFADAHNNLGITLHDLGQFGEAVTRYHRALQIAPDYAQAHFNLGITLHDLGRPNEAELCYRRALQIKPDYFEAHSILLFLLSYAIGRTPSDYLAEAHQYGRQVSKKVSSQFSQWSYARHPERLRVGLVSGDFGNHPVGYFLECLLAEIDQSAIELIAYPTSRLDDELTARIRPHFSAWKPIISQGDEAAARMIHSDGIHVLIDLTGHTGHYNRLPIFAWKPAPVQVSWLGYFASTGVPTMDYLIADPWTLPKTDDGHFTEKIWRLPETRLCFTVPNFEIAVSPLPALANGYLTFGCFNNLRKMNDAVVALWAKVLASVPDSRLFLKTKQFQEPSVRQNTVERFAAHGIAIDRLILEGRSPRTEYLATYSRVDIALDPFPYTGGTTSAEGLWMGVPVLTLAGDRLLSRQGVGLLMNAGLPEWIAADADDYVARAISHASNLPRLAALRQRLRQQVLASPVFDAPRFARHFEAAMHGMWQEWAEMAGRECDSFFNAIDP